MIRNLLLFMAAGLMAASSLFAQTPQPVSKVCKAVPAPDEDSEIVFEIPDGEQKFFSRNCDSFKNDYFEGVSESEIKGSVVRQVYVAEDGNVWLSNPMSDFTLLSYVRASFDAEGSIVIEGPQYIYEEYDDWTEDYVKVYLIPMVIKRDAAGATYVAADDMKYVLKKTENGYEAANPDLLLGLATYGELADLEGNPTGESGYAWLGYGEKDIVLTEQEATNGVCPPAEATVERWAYTDPYENALINVVLDGNDMYIQGIDRGVKDAWVKAKISDGIVTIPSGTFLGYNESIMYYSYIWGSIVEYDPAEDTLRGTPTEEVVFNYDPVAKALTLKNGYAICSVPDDYYLLTLYEEVWINWQNRNINTPPVEPYDLEVTPYDDYFEAGMMDFIIPDYDEDGNLLDQDKLYYTIYINNDRFVFTPESYPWLGLTEDTVNMPFALYDNDMIFVYRNYHSVYFNFELPENGCGVQSVYINEEGKELRSPIVYYGNVGVNKVGTEKEVVSRTYYNMQGMSVSESYKGMVICKTLYDDGTVEVSKSLRVR